MRTGWAWQRPREPGLHASQLYDWRRRHMPKGVIVHIDHGVQYCSNDFQQPASCCRA